MLKQKIKTVVEFTKNLKTSGALYPTSKKVEKEITSRLSNQPHKVFVEFGLGHGNITLEVLKNIHETSRLYSFEVNEDFCEHVQNSIQDDRLVIINDSAEQIGKHISRKVDGIVSSIPMTLFPKYKRREIIQSAYQSLNTFTFFSQILYSTRMKKTMEKEFDSVELVKLVSLPMEFVHHCQKA